MFSRKHEQKNHPLMFFQGKKELLKLILQNQDSGNKKLMHFIMKIFSMFFVSFDHLPPGTNQKKHEFCHLKKMNLILFENQ